MTVTATLTTLPGTFAIFAGCTRYCSVPLRVRIINMPSPRDVLTELAPSSCPWTTSGCALRSLKARRTPGATRLIRITAGASQAAAATIRTARPWGARGPRISSTMISRLTTIAAPPK